MSGQSGDAPGRPLWEVAGTLLILTSLAHGAARIASVRTEHLQRVQAAGGVDASSNAQGPRREEIRRVASPLLSANDRSRWATVRSLVDQQTYVIDHVVRDPATGRSDPAWSTIDMVRHKGTDGREHYYSSKPPLLATAVAGVYWMLKLVSGAEISSQPFFVVRAILLLVNLLPLAVYFVILRRLAARFGRSDWSRMFVLAAATWGTFLSAFTVTLNNHLPAAICVLLATLVALPVWNDGQRSWWRFLLAGLFSALAAANELPATSFLAVLAAGLCWQSPLRWLTGFLPAAGLVAAAYFGTNYLAHQSWRMPYAHRADGPVLATVAGDLTRDLVGDSGELARRVPPAVRSALASVGVELSKQTLLLDSPEPGRWVIWDRDGQDRVAVVQRPGELELRAWDNWYEYPGSYWTEGKRVGVDRGEPSRAVYAFHVLLGHHGFFSLSPVWLIGLLGIIVCLRDPSDPLRSLAALVLLLTVVCLVFYVSRPLIDRNYGGVAAGFRWLFWLIPLWLLVTLRGAERLAASAWWRRLALAALAVSVFSALYAAANPWSQPWLFDYWSYLGWIRY
ncbi:MAG: hypothetical protein J5I93_21990 [Pirellulaceae bacterium]|nr:hypothetical protein [Pirellulaceae bacterium]